MKMKNTKMKKIKAGLLQPAFLMKSFLLSCYPKQSCHPKFILPDFARQSFWFSVEWSRAKRAKLVSRRFSTERLRQSLKVEYRRLGLYPTKWFSSNRFFASLRKTENVSSYWGFSRSIFVFINFFCWLKTQQYSSFWGLKDRRICFSICNAKTPAIRL